MTKDEARADLQYLARLGGELPTAKARAIDRAIRQAKLSKREIADALGITRQGLDDFMRRNGVKA